jgi:hypothetical protein
MKTQRGKPGPARTMAALLGLAALFPAGLGAADPVPVLIYESVFATPDRLDDWLVEGPGTKRWKDGAMILEPTATPAVVAYWEKNGRKNLDGASEYYRVAEDTIRGPHPEMVARLRSAKGDFAGGHIVVWNTRCVTPADYQIEFDFRPLTPIGLAIVHFSARARTGGDVLGEGLAPRHGVFRSYTHGDLDTYHISYFANNPTGGQRGTCNLRKNHGFHLLATGPDLCSEGLDYAKPGFSLKAFRVAVRKLGPVIRFTIDGREVFTVTDRGVNDVLTEDGRVAARGVDTGPALAGGRMALRQMVGLSAEYSRFRVYRLSN